MSQPYVVDLHSHWFSPAAVRLLSARGESPRIAPAPGGGPALHRTGPGVPDTPFPLGGHWFDIDARVEHMDRTGVLHQMISWPTTLGVDPAMAPEQSLPLWSAYNDDLAELVRRRPDRFSAVAALSTADVDWSARELARAHDDLGLIGAVLPVNAFASLAAARRFAPVLEVLQSRRGHLYLHTGYAHPSVPGQPPVARHADNPLARGLVDTLGHFAAAFLTLTLTDVLDPYPDVTVQIAMLGGAGFAALVQEQLDIFPERYERADARRRMQRIWLDTGASGNGPHAVTAAVRVLGADRIVFGSDYAPVPAIGPVLSRIEAADLSAEERQAVLHGNGRAILRSRGVSLPEAGRAA